MTCRRDAGGCGYEFCWICGHDWKTHTGDAYQCNRFVDFDSQIKDTNSKSSEINLKRLGHYYTRYMNHIKSAKQEQEMRKKMRKMLLERFRHDRNFLQNDAEQLCEEVFHAIDTARSVLIWSYPHAFFMDPGSNDLAIFEFVQRDVEKNIEDLTFLIENKIVLTQKEIRDAKNLLVSTTEVLNKHVDKYSH